MWRPWRLIVLTMGLLPVCASARASDLSELLHAVFDQHHQRSPSGEELNYHARIQRSQGSLENYVALYSSDDFFITQAQRDLEVYVSRLYEIFLGRSPRPDELRFWVVQFQERGVSRRDLVRRFCRVNHVTQLPSGLPARPVAPIPATAAEIAGELVAQTETFVSLVRNEIGRSRYGRRLVDEGRKLTAVAQQYEQALRSRSSTRQQLDIAAENLEAALQRLESEFQRVPGALRHSQAVLDQISRLVTAARGAPVRRSPPRPAAPASSGYRQIAILRDMLRDFAYGLQRYQDSSSMYANLSRDVQGLMVQIDAVELMMRQDQPKSRIQNGLRSAVTRANHLNADFARSGARIQRAWWDIQTQMGRAADSLGVQGAVHSHPSTPVVIHRPAWSKFPYQHTPRVPSRRNRQAISLADDLTAKIEDYVASLRPLAGRSAGAGRLIGSLQNLKHSAVALRQVAASGAAGTTLARMSETLMAQYKRTAADVTQLVSQDSTLNSPLFYQIGELTYKLREAATGVRS